MTSITAREFVPQDSTVQCLWSSNTTPFLYYSVDLLDNDYKSSIHNSDL